QGYTGVWSMLGDAMIQYDPEFFDDFWTVPGYLGVNPPASLEAARIQHKTTVVEPILPADADKHGLPAGVSMFRTEAMADVPVALRVESVPDGSLMGSMLSVMSGKGAGHNFWVVTTKDDIVVTGVGESQYDGLRSIVAGDEIV